MAATMAVYREINDKFGLAIEPVFYTAIRPKTGSKATRIGDTEIAGENRMNVWREISSKQGCYPFHGGHL